MDVSARSVRTSAMAAVSVVALALTPSATPSDVRLADPAVRLASAAQSLSPDLLDPTPVALPPAADGADGAVLAAGSFDADIEAFYNAVEPWVDYEVNFLSWAFGWIPVAGLLAPQMIFFYDLDESVTQSLVFNTADLIAGTINFSEALSNVDAAATDALNTFVNTETGWIDSLLPPALPTAVDPGVLTDLGTLVSLLP
jgi:hypothetical protein